MSEKAEKKAEATPAPAKDAHGDKKDEGAKKAAGGGGLLAKTPVLLGIVMVIEAVVLFAGFKFLGGGPKQAAAIELKTEESHGGHDEHGGGHDGDHASKASSDKNPIEVVQDFQAINTQTGRHFLYNVSISIVVKSDEDKIKEKVKGRSDIIKDRIGTIIRQIDPDKLAGVSEPNLDTFKRQIKSQLEIILGEGMIEDVLVPKCTPYRADY